ncbi:hypothetical protein C8J57DRAFT_1477951 [Mycena rebaudengoi]|nr:hypothetical protein C8J57DRAFT_1477951 [Mycena rebaudengoi]
MDLSSTFAPTLATTDAARREIREQPDGAILTSAHPRHFHLKGYFGIVARAAAGPALARSCTSCVSSIGTLSPTAVVATPPPYLVFTHLSSPLPLGEAPRSSSVVFPPHPPSVVTSLPFVAICWLTHCKPTSRSPTVSIGLPRAPLLLIGLRCHRCPTSSSYNGIAPKPPAPAHRVFPRYPARDAVILHLHRGLRRKHIPALAAPPSPSASSSSPAHASMAIWVARSSMGIGALCTLGARSRRSVWRHWGGVELAGEERELVVAQVVDEEVAGKKETIVMMESGVAMAEDDVAMGDRDEAQQQAAWRAGGRGRGREGGGEDGRRRNRRVPCLRLHAVGGRVYVDTLLYTHLLAYGFAFPTALARCLSHIPTRRPVPLTLLLGAVETVDGTSHHDVDRRLRSWVGGRGAIGGDTGIGGEATLELGWRRDREDGGWGAGGDVAPPLRAGMGVGRKRMRIFDPALRRVRAVLASVLGGRGPEDAPPIRAAIRNVAPCRWGRGSCSTDAKQFLGLLKEWAEDVFPTKKYMSGIINLFQRTRTTLSFHSVSRRTKHDCG